MTQTQKLAALPSHVIQKELIRRTRRVEGLIKRRKRALDKIAKLDEEIRIHGGHPRTGFTIRRRPKNDMNLVEALGKVLNGKTMSVTEVSVAVQKAGYKTTSPSFRTIVNQTLINSGKFRRVERGRYTSK